MSDTPKKLVHNVETGIAEYIDLTSAELAERDQLAADFAFRMKEIDNEKKRVAVLQESAKAKLVAGEPLTEEEAATLVI